MKRNLFKPLLGGVCAAAMLMTASSVQAIIYSFTQLTANGNQLVASQLKVDVTLSGAGTLFTFSNLGPIASSITDIYFDDGTLLALSTIADSGAGVAFDAPASPGNLPGANFASPAFGTTAGFSADSDSPVTANGVNPGGEWVSIFFTLQGGNTYADTLAALGNGSLRIGLHVQAIGTQGGSESFINYGQPGDVPVPDGGSTIALLGFALVGADQLRRRMFKA